MSDSTSNVQTWRYHLPNVKGEGWAIAFLDAIGCFTVLSDYGNYGHRWPQAGWGPGDFRVFFLQTDDDYVMRKLARRDTYYGDRTLRAVKERILECRRTEFRSREWARQEWDLLDRYDRLYSREDFAMWYTHTRIEDPSELAVYDVDSDVRGFIAHVLPRLREAIRSQLAEQGEIRESA
jgi:hypothetical protein